MNRTQEPTFASWAAEVPKLSGVVSILAGTLVLAGWGLNIPALRTLFLSQSAMRPNSALVHILAGLALLFLLERESEMASAGVWKIAGRALGAVVLVVGALTFSEYLLGLNLHIDQLIFRNADRLAVSAIPGRMTPVRALNFLFFGGGLLLLDIRRRRGFQIAEILALGIILQSMYGIFDRILRPLGASQGLPLHSSLICFVLGAGLLTARPHHQFRRLLASEQSGGAVFRRLIPAALLVPLFIAVLIWWGEVAGVFARGNGLILLAVVTITAFVLIVMWTTESLDVTDRARQAATATLQRINRALRTLSACDLAVVRATDEQSLVQTVCNILVEAGGYRMAWVAYAEHDEAKTVRPVAVAGADDGYLAAAKITWADNEHGHGPTGTAIRNGAPCVVRNILEDKDFAPWREDALKHGYASTVALPLIVEGRPFGALRVYAIAPDAFDDEEMKLLAELAGALAYGLQALRNRAERAQAAEALRESEAKFRQMAENIREVLWMVDADGHKVLYVSPRCEDVWGRCPEKLYEHGLGWASSVHPSDRDRLRSVLAGGIPRKEFEAEYRIVWPDGAVHWVRDRTFPIRDSTGQVRRIVGVTEDITERRIAAEALYESEERYRQLFNEMNVGCALLEVAASEPGDAGEARLVDVNPTFEKITGQKKDAVAGRTMREVFPGANEHWIGRLARVALTGESIHFEAYSEWLKKHLDVTAFRARAGRFAIVIRDITERRQALEALEQAERKYRSIFENAMEGVFQAAEDGRILTANPALARMLGYHSTQQFSREVSSLEQHLCIEPERPTGFFAMLKQQGAIMEFETRMRRKDGSLIWVIGSAYAVRDDAGRVLYYEGTLRDITEHKRAEEALRQLSAQLLRAQDDERRRIARDLHDSTGQNLAALSMNLAWISQFAASWDAKLQAVLKESSDLVKRAVREIRNFSYLLHPPVLDEYGLPAALQWYVQGFSQRSGIQVDVDVPSELPRLTRQAETAMFRVVQECLTNVHRHSGSPRAKIRLCHNFGFLTLEVSDEGQGMSAASLEHAANEVGVGVGIAGMRERMRELGGQLKISSDSRGTSIFASLPLGGEE